MKDFEKIYDAMPGIDKPEEFFKYRTKGYFILSGGGVAVKANLKYRSCSITYALYVFEPREEPIQTHAFAFDVPVNEYGYCSHTNSSLKDFRKYSVLKYVDDYFDIVKYINEPVKTYTDDEVFEQRKKYLISQEKLQKLQDIKSSLMVMSGFNNRYMDNCIHIRTEYGEQCIRVDAFIDENDSAYGTVLGNLEIMLANTREEFYTNLAELTHMQLNHNHTFIDIESSYDKFKECKYCGLQID